MTLIYIVHSVPYNDPLHSSILLRGKHNQTQHNSGLAWSKFPFTSFFVSTSRQSFLQWLCFLNAKEWENPIFALVISSITRKIFTKTLQARWTLQEGGQWVGVPGLLPGQGGLPRGYKGKESRRRIEVSEWEFQDYLPGQRGLTLQIFKFSHFYTCLDQSWACFMDTSATFQIN